MILHSVVTHYGDDTDAWSVAVSRLLRRSVRVIDVEQMGRQGAKHHGMTDSLKILFESPDHKAEAIFLKIPNETVYGETLRADAAHEVCWRLDGYSAIARHARCVCAVRIESDGSLEPEHLAGPAWGIVEEEISGQPYHERLQQMSADPDPEQATREARLICNHMVSLHGRIDGEASVLYSRAIRDNLMNAVFRLIDGAPSLWNSFPELRERVEHGFLNWRLALSTRHGRLRRIHSDYHPWNVFLLNDRVNVIGARAPGFGDPADDLACFLVNYVWFSMRRSGALTEPYLAAFIAFRDRYFELTQDQEAAAVFAPFAAKRLLVFLNPVYYPDTTPAEVHSLLSLLVSTLEDRMNVLTHPEGLRL